MNDSDRNCELNAIVLVVGALAALAVAGIVGRAVYQAVHSPAHVRDVTDIISECQSTISQMDNALHGMHAAHA